MGGAAASGQGRVMWWRWYGSGAIGGEVGVLVYLWQLVGGRPAPQLDLLVSGVIAHGGLWLLLRL